MSHSYIKTTGITVFFLFFGLTFFLHASEMENRIYNATKILAAKQEAGHPIPSKLLSRAKGVAIFDSTKAGIGIGGQDGEGIVIVRKNHSWTAPSAFDVGGASVGAQLGFSQTRYIVLLMTDDAVNHFVYPTNDANWNATATSTVGDDTKTERTATKDPSEGSIIVFKDSDGLFGGATLGGTTIVRKDDVNLRAYGKNGGIQDILSGKATPSKAAKHLYRLLNK